MYKISPMSYKYHDCNGLSGVYYHMKPPPALDAIFKCTTNDIHVVIRTWPCCKWSEHGHAASGVNICLSGTDSDSHFQTRSCAK